MGVMTPAPPPLVLASSSATRAALLRAAGLSFAAMPAAVDEASLKEAALEEGLPPAEAATLLADAKAERLARRMLREEPEALVIGADSLLVCEGRWFDKPEGLEGARAQLRALRGRTHELVSAVVCWRHGARIWHHAATCRLSMREFSDEFLEAYLAAEGEEITYSVGAYRLEGLGMHLFRAVQGEHAAILGLPMLPLLDFLRQHGAVLR
ncbi:Maf-like protein [Roseomonas marmotae]|uniref:Nucleoside triphosphate pyrophosphatase n=2 Tax=Roseomonas marmotae TaxID=2768161 RepID=A0ABS3KCB6_9PROT|nr:nucleoside triphosphate pyrophosphatase [Roseomonas marmotae]MBO1075116.1 Maf-like protein [Roseomonas marmotae]QTI79769.1 Maf-like protein [Roseomonas marmotae]